MTGNKGTKSAIVWLHRAVGQITSTSKHKKKSNTIGMIQIWIALIFLHQGHSLISVTTSQLGEPVSFICWFSDLQYSNTRVKWYKQSIGDTLVLITTLVKGTAHPALEKGFSPSRFIANYTTFKSTLTILKTIKEDEAMYHCAVSTWKTDEWSGTFLSLKESNTRTINYTVVQSPTVSDPVEPAESITLQCSVFSDSQTGSCPSEGRVLWFGVRKDRFLGSIMYTDGNTPYECDRKPETSSDSKSCVYHFLKNISSPDNGIYYCALAMCGEIIFGNGTKVEIEVEGRRWSHGVLLMCTPVAICGLVFVITIIRTKWEFCAKNRLQENAQKQNLKKEEDTQIYSTAVFTMIKNMSHEGKHAKAVKGQKTYAALKPFGVE
ncbi:hypothetical protein ATANTOWER_016321 [Ataeniobius toweri]|uniref:Ig-like domain-containing protein n=1 Tax=Ataeniobius toweri TaxID=208326 RepID=A0ABU7AR22_9TELE|nr:hypothetical protein [Ataeniobius toweri]